MFCGSWTIPIVIAVVEVLELSPEINRVASIRWLKESVEVVFFVDGESRFDGISVFGESFWRHAAANGAMNPREGGVCVEASVIVALGSTGEVVEIEANGFKNDFGLCLHRVLWGVC